MSCCGGNCACGSSCKRGSGCGGCGVYPYVAQTTTATTLIADINAPRAKLHLEGSEKSFGAEAGHACKCGSTCTCDPCNCS